MIRNNERVNERVRIDESRGKPTIGIREKRGDRVSISCQYIGGPTRDNGFVQGTKLSGKLVEKDGVTTLRGIITTEPVYHALFILLIAFFIFQCIRLGGFSLLLPVFIIFNFIMFGKEYKKQGYILRYLNRAARRICEAENTKK
jgi:hypothetical protein